MDEQALILLVEHTTYTYDDKAVLFAVARYRGDRCKFSIELKGGKPTEA
jgi:DNA-binding GntR family transcriptional regulator